VRRNPPDEPRQARRTQAGVCVARTHTASIAGDFEVSKDFLQLFRAFVVDSFNQWN
jgi:hypothetical protein